MKKEEDELDRGVESETADNRVHEDAHEAYVEGESETEGG